MKKVLMYILICTVTILLVINPQRAIYHTKSGMSLCFEIIIPSLFPFFVCSGLLILSGFCEVIAKFFSPVMKPLFNVNASGASAFILGIISGYPLGALTVCQLYQGAYLSKWEAQRLMAFSNNSGPLFIMGAVGVSIYHSTLLGVVLYVAHILGALSVGIIFRFYKKDNYSAPRSRVVTNDLSFPQIYSNAISNSMGSILSVCASVIFCSTISGILLDLVNINGAIKAFLGGVIEFSSGIGKVSALDVDLTIKLLMSAFICAFAGISVHLQVMSVVANSGLSLVPYVVGKVLHGLFSVGYTFLILKFIPVTQTVFGVNHASKNLSGSFFFSSVFVIITVLSILAILMLYALMSLKKHLCK